MAKFNAENERIKHHYLEWVKEACGKADSTVNNIRDALYLFDEHTNFKSFKTINRQDFITFKKQLCPKKNLKTGGTNRQDVLTAHIKKLDKLFSMALQPKGL